MKLVFVYADNETELNTSNWRIFIPAEAINKTKEHAVKTFYCQDFASNSQEVQAYCQDADLIMFERNLFGDHLMSLLAWKLRDKVVTVNFDDAYDKMTKDNFTAKFWIDGKGDALNEQTKETKLIDFKPHPLTQFKWGMSMMAAGFAPSRKIVEDWKSYTNMHYLANYPKIEAYQVEKKEHSGIIIGWGGSLSHVKSWDESDAAKALKRIVEKRSDVRVLFAGDKRVFDKVDLPVDKKIYQAFVPFKRWPEVVANFDIGLAPLAGEFDKRRSWIKPLEYCIMGIPWVATDNGAYDELRKYGSLVKNQYHLWEQAITDIIENLEEKRQFANDVAKPFAYKQDINLNVDKIISLFKEVIKEGYRS